MRPRYNKIKAAPGALVAALVGSSLVGGTACGFLRVNTPQPPAHSRLCGESCAAGKTPPRQRRRPPPHRGPLTLRQALTRALKHHPDLAVAAQDRRVAGARARSANRYPNPALHVDVEDWLGSGDVRQVRALQLTIQVSQDIELGRKLASRRQLARVTRRAVGWDYARKRAAVLAETTQAFVRVLYEQQRLAIARDQTQLADRFLKTVRKRHEAGQFKPGEVELAGIRRDLSRVEQERSRRRLRQARLALVAHWGATEPRFKKATGRLRRLPVLPSLETLLARATDHPAARRLGARVAERRAQLQVERSLAYPDLSLRAGYRWLEGSRDSAFVLGISIPLPFFSRNTGAIEAARHRVARAKLTRRVFLVRANLAIKQTYERLRAALFAAKMLRAKVLPTSRRSYDKLREGYQLGRVGYLAVLEAQRTCFAVQQRYLESLLQLHTAAITLQRLAGALDGSARTPNETKRPPGPARR